MPVVKPTDGNTNVFDERVLGSHFATDYTIIDVSLADPGDCDIFKEKFTFTF